MTTNTTVLQPPAVHTANPVLKMFGKTLTFSSPGTTVALRLGTLPAGAMVVGGGAYVTTAFDDTGNDFIDIGTTSDDDAFATDLDVSSKGLKVLDEMATTDDYNTAEIGVTATYAGANANATVGSAYVFVYYIEPQG